ncbi:unnamed protein product [Cuscuta epithymum]|uniref:Thioredoxin domain-containing protein n=1 Tax=Cuscuta epithymum TaxID=186058 RepID=A0AAV0CZ37_9ASTE|nr:unnamed protein product [Cuscuta epithymum]
MGKKMESGGNVISCHTTETWDNVLSQGMQEKRLMIVDFTASWCGPCRTIAPFVASLARSTPDVLFLKVDVDELPLVAEDWGVKGMPTFMFLKEGRILESFVGARKDKLQQLLAKHSMKSPTTSYDSHIKVQIEIVD